MRKHEVSLIYRIMANIIVDINIGFYFKVSGSF